MSNVCCDPRCRGLRLISMLINRLQESTDTDRFAVVPFWDLDWVSFSRTYSATQLVTPCANLQTLQQTTGESLEASGSDPGLAKCGPRTWELRIESGEQYVQESLVGLLRLLCCLDSN
eukprot:6461621-Amphidinium_carterae.2